jgi:hypothetical protein
MGPSGPPGPSGAPAGNIVSTSMTWASTDDAGKTASAPNGFMGTNTKTLTCPDTNPIALTISVSSTDPTQNPAHATATATSARNSANVTEHGYTVGVPFLITVKLSCFGP